MTSHELPITKLPKESYLRPPRGDRPAWMVGAFLLVPALVLIGLYYALPPDAHFVIILGALPVSVGVMAYLIFRMSRSGKDKETAIRLLEARNLELAEITFEEMAINQRRPVSQHAESLFYMGVINLLGSKLDKSLALFSSVASYPGLSGWATLNERLPGWFALAYALNKQYDEAQQWIDAGVERCDEVSSALLIMPKAVLKLRRDQSPDGAIELLTRDWTDAEVLIAIDMLREMRVIRAYALACMPSKKTHSDEIFQLLEGVAGSPQGSFSFLGATWPEMAGFLETRGLEPSLKENSPKI